MGSYPVNLEKAHQIRCMFEQPRICETKHLRVENRYSALELLCGECEEIDCSNASHDSSMQDSISYFDSDIACADNYARLNSEHKGLHVTNVNICYIKPKLDELIVQIRHSVLMRNVS